MFTRVTNEFRWIWKVFDPLVNLLLLRSQSTKSVNSHKVSGDPISTPYFTSNWEYNVGRANYLTSLVILGSQMMERPPTSYIPIAYELINCSWSYGRPTLKRLLWSGENWTGLQRKWWHRRSINSKNGVCFPRKRALNSLPLATNKLVLLKRK